MDTPHHIAIIMDGNGRWAERRKRPRSMGHQAGVKAVRAAVKACVEQGVAVLTLFAFSSENWRRPRSEVSSLMDLFLRALDREVAALLDAGVRLNFIGDRAAFGEEIAARMTQAEEKSADKSQLLLNVAANYGGRWDILRAAQRLARAAQELPELLETDDPTTLDPFLSLAGVPDPDLMIRTGGTQRISNFLLWQCAYTEFYFTDVLWPDFGERELAAALETFTSRQRRFGQTSAQITSEETSPRQGNQRRA